MNTKKKAEIWKEYFDKLLNTEEPRALIKKGNKKLKYNKVPVTDEIHPELIKYGGKKLLTRMYELVRQIWEEKKTPGEWQETTIAPIHKFQYFC
jgi:hypothetical protein